MKKCHCYKCDQYKIRAEFYPDKSRNNLLTSKCKECMKKCALQLKKNAGKILLIILVICGVYHLFSQNNVEYADIEAD